ncbi:hypothetical protein V6X63_10280 [Spiribacter sp. 221]
MAAAALLLGLTPVAGASIEITVTSGVDEGDVGRYTVAAESQVFDVNLTSVSKKNDWWGDQGLAEALASRSNSGLKFLYAIDFGPDNGAGDDKIQFYADDGSRGAFSTGEILRDNVVSDYAVQQGGVAAVPEIDGALLGQGMLALSAGLLLIGARAGREDISGLTSSPAQKPRRN